MYKFTLTPWPRGVTLLASSQSNWVYLLPVTQVNSKVQMIDFSDVIIIQSSNKTSNSSLTAQTAYVCQPSKHMKYSRTLLKRTQSTLSMIIINKDSIIEAYKKSSFPPLKKIMCSTTYPEIEEKLLSWLKYRYSMVNVYHAILEHTYLQSCTSNKS